MPQPSDPPNDFNSSDLPSETASTQPQKISRRQFGRKAAVAAAASLSVPALLAPELTAQSLASEGLAQEKPSTKPKPPASAATAARAKSREPLKGLTPKQVADVDAKLANILRKHPDRFSDAQKKRLRRILAQHERLLAPVRAFHVENGDSPASVLRILFEDVELPAERRGE